jgi:hypothetical protein
VGVLAHRLSRTSFPFILRALCVSAFILSFRAFIERPHSLRSFAAQFAHWSWKNADGCGNLFNRRHNLRLYWS